MQFISQLMLSYSKKKIDTITDKFRRIGKYHGSRVYDFHCSAAAKKWACDPVRTGVTTSK
jgi:hypothetical protein